jgi:hypothetical protein
MSSDRLLTAVFIIATVWLVFVTVRCHVLGNCPECTESSRWEFC